MTNSLDLANAETLGSNIQSLADAMNFHKIKARKLLASHGMEPPHEGKWYPVSKVLAVYRDVLHQVGPSTMRSIGRYIPKHAVFPAALSSFEAVLDSLNEAYRMNHRGSDNLGGYHYYAQGERTCRIVCDNPYPCEFDQGIIEALYTRFQPPGSYVLRLDHETSGCRHAGADSCTYLLKW